MHMHPQVCSKINPIQSKPQTFNFQFDLYITRIDICTKSYNSLNTPYNISKHL
ncbi:hypothetical protein HanXRQr2_Chr11g0477401 [Helianthus annuus]|uniref:Uncharacterized protein n=1 Tax=Helianthus annuus TaxID=4232 RepID=A0A9K3HMI2_HELAN|nr:hypothetical protein HanXRQr2_Chr11g0477401 [Helianthus annuus]